MEKLPVYELRISEDEDAIVDCVSIVDQPAIESNFLAFSQSQKNITFSADDERMELIGAAMIPDMKIYRSEPSAEGYYVYFTKETIRNIAQVFMKKGLTTAMNLDHSSKDAQSYIYQSYIVDTERGMNSPKGLDLPEGSWVVGVKVLDKTVWQSIKEGKRAGFSVEGLFQMFKTEFKSASVNKEEDEIDEQLLKAFDRLTKTLSKTK